MKKNHREVLRISGFCCLTALLFVASCNSKQSPPLASREMINPAASVEPTPIADETERSVTELIKTQLFLEPEKKAALLKTWKRVPDHENYRMVRPSDFKIPAWVQKEFYWSDVVHSTGWSSDYGEMSGAHGLIAFMIDKRITDDNRFSVVVFIERPGNKYSVHWIFRDRDLSRANLRRHSGDVYFQEFREDGTSRSCDVQWSRDEKRWGCNLDA